MKSPDHPSSEAAPSQTSAVTVEQAIAMAIGLQQRFELDAAAAIYEQVLEFCPRHPDALHFYGVLQHQRGSTPQACRLISQALALAPDYIDAYNNMGNIHRECDHLDDAEACYRKVIALDSRHAGAYNNLGSLLRARGMLDQAQAAYRQALSLDPDLAASHLNLGHLLTQSGQLAEAVSYYAQSIVLDPELSASKRHLGIALSCLGRIPEAADVFRQWVQNEPDNAEARHLYAACSGEEVPARAPDVYVKQVFDHFAGSFEERLATLDYRAPQLVADAVRRTWGVSTAAWTVLDAGCGTGWCGPLLRPFARRLVGVDLSPGMLKRARTRGCYDALQEAELTAYIRDHAGEFDCIVSADTLCYFGDLADVFSAAARSLTGGRHLVFTLELDGDPLDGPFPGYRIQPHGRYCHSEIYVREVAAKAGFAIKALSHDTLRQEMGRSVAGMVATLQAM